MTATTKQNKNIYNPMGGFFWLLRRVAAFGCTGGALRDHLKMFKIHLEHFAEIPLEKFAEICFNLFAEIHLKKFAEIYLEIFAEIRLKFFAEISK